LEKIIGRVTDSMKICVFIPFNNHKIMFYKYLYVLKARVILENYNFCDRSQE